jgi:hypothetical protein
VFWRVLHCCSGQHEIAGKNVKEPFMQVKM